MNRRPAIASSGERVVIAGALEMCAFDAPTGERLWRVRADVLASPVAAPDGVAAVSRSEVSSASLSKHDWATGKELWTRKLPGAGSRVAALAATDDRYVVLLEGSVISVDRATGTLESSVAVVNAIAMTVSATRAVVVGDKALFGIDLRLGRIEWSQAVGDDLAPVIRGDSGVAVVLVGGRLTGIDPRDGNTMWTLPPGASGPWTVHPAGVLVFDAEGGLSAYSARKGQLVQLSSTKVGQPTTMPGVTPEVVYMATADAIVALDPSGLEASRYSLRNVYRNNDGTRREVVVKLGNAELVPTGDNGVAVAQPDGSVVVLALSPPVARSGLQ